MLTFFILLFLLGIPNYACADVDDEIKEGTVESVQRFLQNEDEKEDFIREDILFAAARYGKLDIIKYILAHGVNIDTRDDMNYSALSYAVDHKQMPVIQYLLSHNAKIDDTDGYTALVPAVVKADTALIDLLLEKGGDINAILCEGDTCTSPLRCAAQMGNFTLFMYLLDKGADLAKKLPYDQYDGNILNAAVLGGNLDIVKYIISKGFDIHYSEKHLKRSLLASAMNSDSLGVLEVIDYLVKAGLDVNYKDAYKKTVFYYVWVSEDETKEEKNIKAKVLLRILDKGLRVNTTDEVGNTPLHYACELGFSDVVAALLKKNAKVNAQNEQGETPLDIARKKGNPDIIRMLEVATKK